MYAATFYDFELHNFFLFFFVFSNYLYICNVHRRYFSYEVNRVVGRHIFKKRRLLTFLSLAYRNLANSLSRQKQGNGRCPWDMFISFNELYTFKVSLICCTYRRGRLALLVLARWAMREPLYAGRVTSTDSRAFSFYMG